MTSKYSNPKKIYLVEQRKNHELNLEHIDEEMRMEQVRQLASKLEWSALSQQVRRNLLEKRNTLDADARIDLLKGIAFMKTKMPIDPALRPQERFRIMAESLACTQKETSRGWLLENPEVTLDFTMHEDNVTGVKLSFWNEPAYISLEAKHMLEHGEYTEFRNMISRLLATYAKDIVGSERTLCKTAMKMLEVLLYKYSADTNYSSVNGTNYGYYLRRGELKAGRLYYLVKPLYKKASAKLRKFHLDKTDHDELPYFEFSFVKNDGPCKLPEYIEGDIEDWSKETEADVAVCLKLSKGVLMSEATRKKLGAISAKTATIRHYTNCYRFMTGEVKIKEDMRMITQFPDGAQHMYTIDHASFRNDDDTVITEIFLNNLQDFHEVIALLRNECMHMSLWESIMAMCYEKQGIAEHKVSAIDMHVFLSRESIVISFNTIYAPIKMYISDSGVLEFKVQVVNGFTGQQIAARIDETLSRKLNETWNIPVMLTYAVSGEDCNLSQIKVPLRKENPETRARTPPPPIKRRPRK
ncbi:unnamed protein product [Caenorhabditis sp. 36 PRJEB53466]|nr:unnamed protein product [Caenorhabditis sp. 36 PRJEB53466]